MPGQGPHSGGAWQLRVRGLVQGVGFRPAVWRLATKAALTGEVLNDAQGVLIRLACDEARAGRFAADLRHGAPPLSRIDSIDITPLRGVGPWPGFAILASKAGPVATGIVPDAATCPDCLSDILDPENRRYGYAFTNCTNCGPRLSITRAIPYDRANTAMAGFDMCADCAGEYRDPGNRRFHAQPNACPACGPQIWMVDATGTRLDGPVLTQAAALLQAGHIVAIKGLGGFQLACDAGNPEAVRTLRRRKKRAAKPLALMARDVAQVQDYVTLTASAAQWLESPGAPIVLAPVHAGANALAADIAPGQNRLGFMLPNTPLHHLLMRALKGPIVLTSGNLSNEPQAIDNQDALQRLRAIADFWLLHDRDVVNRLDDSVVQMLGEDMQILRRARGFAPAPLGLHPDFADAAPVLAMGGDLKNTFCLLQSGQAVVSQHMGDMENPATHRDVRKNLELYCNIFDMRPAAVAVDGHPGYFSARLGREIAATQGAAATDVQHHHAHVAAVLAEHRLGPQAAPVLGVVLDGLGYGEDGTLWGGEFLLADFTASRRLAHFDPMPLPGGEKANQQPWRNTLAHLLHVFGPDALDVVQRDFGDLPVLAALRAKPWEMMAQMIDRGLNSPPTTSAGRVFDAVAGALGLCFDQIGFEGQAAMQVQMLAESAPATPDRYEIATADVIRWEGLWRGMLADLRDDTPRGVIAAKVHNALIDVIVKTADRLALTHGTERTVLAGGVFQNGYLLRGVQSGLAALGHSCLTPVRFPANDGAVSLGQAAILAARALRD